MINYHQAKPDGLLEESRNAAFLVDVDGQGRRSFGQARHGHDVSRDGHEEPRPGGDADLADGDGEVPGPPLDGRVVGEGGLGLGHADQKPVQSQGADGLEVLLGLVGEGHVVGAVDLGGDGPHFLLGGKSGVVEEVEGLGLVAGGDDLPGQIEPSLASLGPDFGEGHGSAQGTALLLDEGQFLGTVRGEGIDGDDDGKAEALDVLDVLLQVGDARGQGLHVELAEPLLGHASVHLQGPYGGDDDDGVGLEAGQAALDVEELLGAQVGGEARLGDEVVGQFEAVLGGHDAVAAVGDVGEGAAVDEGRNAFEGLDEVGLEGVLEEHGHGPLSAQIAGRDGPVVVGVGDDDPGQAFLQIGDARGETEDGHDLRGDGDVEAVLPGHALGLASQADDDVAEGPVVHVHDAAQDDAAGVDVELVALLERVVDHGGQQVVGRRDGMDVAGEVDVDVLHGDDLAVAASGGSALDAEDGAQRGLPQGQGRLLAQPGQSLGQAYGGRRLPLSGRRRRDGRDKDQLAVVVAPDPLPEVERDLGLVLAVVFKIVVADSEFGGDGIDGLHDALLGDVDVGEVLAHIKPPRHVGVGDTPDILA